MTYQEVAMRLGSLYRALQICGDAAIWHRDVGCDRDLMNEYGQEILRQIHDTLREWEDQIRAEERRSSAVPAQ